ncbi:MAG: hypothetical protein AB7H70_14600 [Rhodospirillaceae bacterium]
MGNPNNIPTEATIADITATLDNATEYVRRVLANMAVCKRKYGKAFVRIGTTGRGIAPHYRVDPGANFMEQMEDDAVWQAHFMAFHGRSHKQLPWGFGELKGEHWSSGKMSFEEIQSLLGLLRQSHKRVRR